MTKIDMNSCMAKLELKGSANGLNVDTLISQNIFEDEETGEVIINLPHPLAEKVAEYLGLEPVEK